MPSRLDFAFLLFILLILGSTVTCDNDSTKEGKCVLYFVLSFVKHLRLLRTSSLDFEAEIESVVLAEGDLEGDELRLAQAKATKGQDCDGDRCSVFKLRLLSAINLCKSGRLSFTKSWRAGKIISNSETTVAIDAKPELCGCACEHTIGCTGIHRNTQKCFFHRHSDARIDTLELSVYWTNT